MPELPEVETTVRQLRKEILDKKFTSLWVGDKKVIKKPSLATFKKNFLSKKIKKIERRGKNILIFLEDDKIILIHLKLTGHLLLDKWEKINNTWKPALNPNIFLDPVNRFLRIIFFLNDGRGLALSDLRRFAKIEGWLENEFEREKPLSKLGPEPLEEKFDFEAFKKRIFLAQKRPIKVALMDQEIIAGIGNIYSDEILWQAKVHPLRKVKDLTPKELKKIFLATKDLLSKAIELGGESISDFRHINGSKGNFDALRKVYRREGEKCSRCNFKISRLKILQRSSYFCPNCQRLK